MFSYFIIMATVGVPLFFIELSLGQFTSCGPLFCWEMAPFFKGIGFAMAIVSSLLVTYYNVIIAWCIFYLFASINTVLPWSKCEPEWASEFCIDDITIYNDPIQGKHNCTKIYNLTAAIDGVCYNYTTPYINKFGIEKNYHVHGIWNKTLALEQNPAKKPILASEDYLNGYALGTYYSRGIDNLSIPKYEIVFASLLSWMIVIVSLIKGVKAAGKIVYVTVLGPYVVLAILFINGLLLEGNYEGLEFYILKLNASRLSDISVWKDAASQVFFSVSTTFGGLIELSSYNKFHNDCLRDTLFICVINALTTLFAGFVVFSHIGYLARQLQTSITGVAQNGVTLAFVIYPEVFARMQGSVFWSLIFFLTLIAIGLDSLFGLTQTITTSIFYEFPKLRNRNVLVTVGLTGSFFLLGLPMTCYGGVYLLQIVDYYAIGWNALIVAFCELLCISYVYGFFRYAEDIGIMLGETTCWIIPWNKYKWYWIAMWAGFAPLTIILVIGFFVADNQAGEQLFLGDYVYPSWATVLGWLMSLSSIFGLCFLPLTTLVIQVFKQTDIKSMFKPTRKWGPYLPEHRELMGNYVSPDDYDKDPWNTIIKSDSQSSTMTGKSVD